MGHLWWAWPCLRPYLISKNGLIFKFLLSFFDLLKLILLLFFYCGTRRCKVVILGSFTSHMMILLRCWVREMIERLGGPSLLCFLRFYSLTLPLFLWCREIIDNIWKWRRIQHRVWYFKLRCLGLETIMRCFILLPQGAQGVLVFSVIIITCFFYWECMSFIDPTWCKACLRLGSVMLRCIRTSKKWKINLSTLLLHLNSSFRHYFWLRNSCILSIRISLH